MYNKFVFSWKASGTVLRLWAGSRASLHKDRFNFIWNQSSRVLVILTMLSCKQDKQASLVCLSAAWYRCEFVIWSCQKSPPTEKLDLQMQTAKDNLWEKMVCEKWNVGAVEETQKQQEAFQAQGFSL